MNNQNDCNGKYPYCVQNPPANYCNNPTKTVTVLASSHTTVLSSSQTTVIAVIQSTALSTGMVLRTGWVTIVILIICHLSVFI